MSEGYQSVGFTNSRQFAAKLIQIAEWLNLRDEFALENGAYLSGYNGKMSIMFDDKEKFVAAVKAVGDADKEYTTDESFPKLIVHAKWAPLVLSISRDKVCKKTVVYDCESLFSEAEVEAL